jgi:hypothetical protein
VARFAIVVRNVSDLVRFFECQLPLVPSHDRATAVPDLILRTLIDYRKAFNEKFAAVALPRSLADQCPTLCLQLWKELDAVPYVIAREPHQRTHADQGERATFSGWEEKQIDEQADSIARKCIRYTFQRPLSILFLHFKASSVRSNCIYSSFGIGHVPPTQLDLHGMVAVDTDSRVCFVNEAEYRRTVGDRTWTLLQHYAGDLRQRKVKVAFFSSTAHGRPDISTRHALIRLARCLGVGFQWLFLPPHNRTNGQIFFFLKK